MVSAWLLFPLLFVLACAGAGALLVGQRPERHEALLVIPVGFAGLIVSTHLLSAWSVTVVVLLLPIVVGLAAIARRPQLHARVWLLPFVFVGLAFAAPALLVFQPTFLGYASLGDASVHFMLVDWIRQHGYGGPVAGDSTYAQYLNAYFGSAYPTGTHALLAALTQIPVLEVAWLFQPFLAVTGAFAVLPLLHLLLSGGTGALAANVAAILSASPALVYAYSVQQQAIKEQSAIVLILTLCAFTAEIPRLRPEHLMRTVFAMVVVAAALLSTLGLPAGAWLAPLALLAALLALRNPSVGLRRLVVLVPAAVLGVAILAVPILTRANPFLEVAPAVLSAAEEFGNLGRRLSFVQAFGVWPTGDFRVLLPPVAVTAWTAVGAAVTICVLGAAAVVEARAWRIALPAIVLASGYAVIATRASPWAQGKGLMLLSVGLMLLSSYLIGHLSSKKARWQAAVAALALVGGVGWSNALAYHDADPAPYGRLSEMDNIGERFSGQGPAVYVEFEEFAKYFLRRLDPTGTNESLHPTFSFAERSNAGRFGFSGDLDDLTAKDSRRFRLAVLRRAPGVSRPPTGWVRVYRGTHYDVWRRDPSIQVVEHVPLGDEYDAVGQPDCQKVQRLVEQARRRRLDLYAAQRDPGLTVTTGTAVPVYWRRDAADPSVLRPGGPGRLERAFSSVEAGQYTVWLQASLVRAARVKVDGSYVGRVRGLNPRDAQVRVGRVRLTRGRHRLSVTVGGGDLRPGNGGYERLLGSATLTSDDDPTGATRVVRVPLNGADDLCRQEVDWLELVARSAG